MTTGCAGHAHLRWRPGVLLFTAALALLLSVFADPAIGRAYDGDYYSWCQKTLKQGNNYCCQQAGGVLLSGSCVDPAVVYTPPPPTINPYPGAPIIVIPPGVGGTP